MGQQNEACKDLYVQNNKMDIVQFETYLGDTISSDGSNAINLNKRCNKRNRIVNQVNLVLKEAYLGKHHFHTGLLLRDTNLINGILYNSESWYGFTTEDAKQLEQIDEMYIRQFFLLILKPP